VGFGHLRLPHTIDYQKEPCGPPLYFQYFIVLSLSMFHMLCTSHHGSNSTRAPIVISDKTGRVLKGAEFCTSLPNPLKYEMEEFQ
jgi:hypothetical protein